MTLETRRTCVHLYLVNEMAQVPDPWPIVAIGKQPFELAAMMFPSRAVIGIPHPTGAFGDQFSSLFATRLSDIRDARSVPWTD